jgi:hypothetical protein
VDIEISTRIIPPPAKKWRRLEKRRQAPAAGIGPAQACFAFTTAVPGAAPANSVEPSCVLFQRRSRRLCGPGKNAVAVCTTAVVFSKIRLEALGSALLLGGANVDGFPCARAPADASKTIVISAGAVPLQPSIPIPQSLMDSLRQRSTPLSRVPVIVRSTYCRIE